MSRFTQSADFTQIRNSSQITSSLGQEIDRAACMRGMRMGVVPLVELRWRAAAAALLRPERRPVVAGGCVGSGRIGSAGAAASAGGAAGCCFLRAQRCREAAWQASQRHEQKTRNSQPTCRIR